MLLHTTALLGFDRVARGLDKALSIAGIVLKNSLTYGWMGD